MATLVKTTEAMDSPHITSMNSALNSFLYRGAAREHRAAIEVLLDVRVTLHDGLEGGVMDAASLLSDGAG